MSSSRRTWLRRSRLLVMSSRTIRALPEVWRTNSSKLVEQRQQQQTQTARRQQGDDYLATHAIRKLQIGAGDNKIPGWLNTDLEPTCVDILYLDALEPFPFDDDVFDYLFSEHMIEHIPYKGGLLMLAEAYRVLKPGGRIRIATPDAEKIVGLYTQEKTEAQCRYLEWSSKYSLGLYSPELSTLQQRRSEWNIDYQHFNRFFPDPAQDSAGFIVNNFFRSYGHQFIYDERTLAGTLTAAGFDHVLRYHPGESDDGHLCNIESHQKRIGDEMNRFETMVLEGVKSVRGFRQQEAHPGS